MMVFTEVSCSLDIIAGKPYKVCQSDQGELYIEGEERKGYGKTRWRRKVWIRCSLGGWTLLDETVESEHLEMMKMLYPDQFREEE